MYLCIEQKRERERGIIFTAMKVGCIKIPRRRRRRQGQGYGGGGKRRVVGVWHGEGGYRWWQGPLPLVTVRTQSCVKLAHLQSAPSMRGGGGRIHYFASGAKSRDGKRSFILSLYILFFFLLLFPLYALLFSFFFSFFFPFFTPPGNKEEFPFYRTAI